MKRFEFLEEDAPSILEQTKGILHKAYVATSDFVDDVVNGPDVAESASDNEEKTNKVKLPKPGTLEENKKNKEENEKAAVQAVKKEKKEVVEPVVNAKLNSLQTTVAKTNAEQSTLNADKAKSTQELFKGTRFEARLGADALETYGKKLDALVDRFVEGMVGHIFGPSIRGSLRTAFIETFIQGLSDDVPKPVAKAEEKPEEKVSRMNMFHKIAQNNKAFKGFADKFMVGLSPMLNIAGLGAVLKENIIMRSNFFLVFEQAHTKNLINQNGLINGQQWGASILNNPRALSAYLISNKHTGNNFGSELWASDKSMEIEPIIGGLFDPQSSGSLNITALADAVSGKLTDEEIETLKLGLVSVERTTTKIDMVKKMLDGTGLTTVLKPLAGWLATTPFAGLITRFFGNLEGGDPIASDDIGSDTQTIIDAYEPVTDETTPLVAGVDIESISKEEAIATYGSTPAVKNFNAGNIREGNGFKTFATPAAGFVALVNFVKGKINGDSKKYNPEASLVDYMKVYAPKGDGNNDPVAYATNIGKLLGIDVGTKLKDIDPVKLAIAHAKFEDGNSFKMLSDLGIIDANNLTSPLIEASA